MKPELVTPEIIEFLCERLDWPGQHTGVSSDALVRCAVLDLVPASGNHPHDLGDLGRCCYAFHRAPWDLQKRMLPTLRDWFIELGEKYSEELA